MQTQKCRVAQQYVGGTNNGGLKTEYEALTSRTSIAESYDLVPIVLNDPHDGISLSDIRAWRNMVCDAASDIIHIRGAGVESLNAVIGAKLAHRGKILVTVHGMFSDLVYYSPVKRWVCRHIIEPMIFDMSDGISCVYKKAKDRDVFKRYKKKMLPHVYNRMPTYPLCDEMQKLVAKRKLDLPIDVPIGVYVGRVTEEKGLVYLTDAIKLLDEKVIILIVGDGNYLQEMRSLCDDDRVVFAGQQEDVRKYLFASDFFISPSLHENLSISILEACAARLPCIVTDVGGNTEIVRDGVNGIVIPPYSAAAISDAIHKMCDEKIRAGLCESAAGIDYSDFSDDNVDEQLRSVYDALMQNNEKAKK